MTVIGPFQSNSLFGHCQPPPLDSACSAAAFYFLLIWACVASDLLWHHVVFALIDCFQTLPLLKTPCTVCLARVSSFLECTDSSLTKMYESDV